MRYICREENRSFKGFCVSLIRPILAYIKGLALAAVLLIPKIYLSMTSGRVGSADLGSLWYYEKRYYADLLTGITGNNAVSYTHLRLLWTEHRIPVTDRKSRYVDKEKKQTVKAVSYTHL